MEPPGGSPDLGMRGPWGAHRIWGGEGHGDLGAGKAWCSPQWEHMVVRQREAGRPTEKGGAAGAVEHAGVSSIRTSTPSPAIAAGTAPPGSIDGEMCIGARGWGKGSGVAHHGGAG